jgi:hypothetical protein
VAIDWLRDTRGLVIDLGAGVQLDRLAPVLHIGAGAAAAGASVFGAGAGGEEKTHDE